MKLSLRVFSSLVSSAFSPFRLRQPFFRFPNRKISPLLPSIIGDLTMTGKAKPKKHTAKEIAAKVDAATTNRGGGKAGQADRSGVEKGGHAKFECPLCRTTAPDVKSMQIHHDARHPKIPFEESKLVNLHASHVVEPSKPRPGVRGSHKK